MPIIELSDQRYQVIAALNQRKCTKDMNTSNATTVNSNELKQIMHEKGLTIAQLATIAGVGVGTVHKLLQKDPNINITLQVLDKIAKALDVPFDALLNNNKSILTVSSVKLIEWHKILSRHAINNTATKLVSVHCDFSKQAFAVKMLGNSMEPVFPNGTILVFDPEAKIYDGCFALLKVADKAVFKQVFIEPPEIFYTSLRVGTKNLKPITKDNIIGTLVESTSISFGFFA